MIVFDVTLRGCLMGVGEVLDLLLQVLKGGLEACHFLLMMVLSGPDSRDETMGNGLEDRCIKIWAPTKDVSGRVWGEWWLWRWGQSQFRS